MDVTIWQLLAFVTAMNALLLLGVFIGGWLVFRVRMNGEPMFVAKSEDKGGVFNLDDSEELEPPEVPEEMLERSKDFINNLMKKKEDYSMD